MVRHIRAGFPLSNRLFREIRAELLAERRGSEKRPGRFRTSQNWIGGPRPGLAEFVPPPPDRVQECMADLERFLHDRPQRTLSLLKGARSDVQFEMIHSFLDGNGCVGGFLIPLLMVSHES